MSRSGRRQTRVHLDHDARPPRSRRDDVPALLVAPAAAAGLLLLLPVIALLARIEWAALPAVIVAPETLTALGLSLLTASIATVACLALGVPLAFMLARTHGVLSGLLRGLVTLPLVLPPLVGGLALLSLLGRGGALGDFLLGIGVRVPFTTAAVVIAQTFVALPFLVITVEGALQRLNPVFGEAAATLGASPMDVLSRVTLPMIAPSLLAGTILSFTRALGEFGATALFAGNQEGVTRTVPLAIYTAFNGAGVGQDTALALSFILIAISIITLIVIRPRRSNPFSPD